MATPTSEETLAASLVAMGSTSRLALLRALRTPRVLSEIVVHGGEPGQPARPLARQTIRRHLDFLLEAGLVESRQVVREYGETTEFVVNHQRAFMVSEQIRALARIRPAVLPEGETVKSPTRAPKREPGPTLTLVKGAEDGATFDLQPPARVWRIGRRRDLEICLDYDPTISGENARIEGRDREHVLADSGSRNGTWHNHRQLAPGERVVLRHGDLIGVGLSLLLYWA